MKKILFLIASLICLNSVRADAAVFVNTGAGGTNICVNRAQDGSAPSYAALGSISFFEGANNDITFGAHVIVIGAPAGWVFNTAVPPSVTFTAGRNIASATFIGMTTTTVTINVVTSATTMIDVFNVIGLQVQATNTTSLPGNVRPLSISGITGVTTATNLASLSLLVPSVSFGQSPAGAICAGTNVTFNALPTNGGVAPTYTWELNGSAVATGTTYANSTLVNGNTVRVVMVSSGCVTTVNATTATMTVNPLPAALTGSLSLCQGATTTLSSTTLGGGWISSTVSVATVSGGTVSGVNAGTSNISYTLPTGCRTVSQVTVNASPAIANVTGGGSFCASGLGVPVGLSASSPSNEYYLSDGTSTILTATGTGSALNFGLFTTPGIYTVSATNPLTSCSRNMALSAIITVASPVTPSVTITSLASLICAGSSETFTANPVNEGPTPIYEWYVNGLYMGGGTAYSYLPAAGDVVSVTLYPGGLCAVPVFTSAVQTIVLTPMATPGVSIASGTAMPSCLGSPVTCTATPSFGGTPPSYRWTKNGVNVATGPGYTYTPANGDIVYCMMTSSYPCLTIDTALSTNMTMGVQVSAALPVVNVVAFPGTNIVPGAPVTFTAIVTSGGSSAVAYQWLVNGTPIPGATNNVTTSTTLVHGDIVTCQVTNMDACSKFSLKSVGITSGATTGVLSSDALFVPVAVVPNPNHGTFAIRGTIPANEDFSVKITNILGQVVYSGVVRSDVGMLNEQVALSHLPSGMYILNLASGNPGSENANQSMHFAITN